MYVYLFAFVFHSHAEITTNIITQGGAQIGAGAGAASALHSVVSRVVCARGAGGALAALRAVCGVWRRDTDPGHAYDLQATLLRLAHPMLQVLSARHVHHALPLFLTVGEFTH